MSESAKPEVAISLREFMRIKLNKLAEDHGNAILKHMEAQQETERLRNQVILYEGAIDYLKKFIEEWDKEKSNYVPEIPTSNKKDC